MAYAFDEGYYIRSVLALLNSGKAVAQGGAPYTEAAFRQAVSDAGLTLKEHYEGFGRFEGLNPNAYFNEREYLAAKLKQLHSLGAADGSGRPHTLESLAKAIAGLGMTPVEHYERIGAYETDAAGNYINPSNAFDANAYFAAKLLQTWISNEQKNGNTGMAVTMTALLESLSASGVSPVTDYIKHGAGEAEATGVAMVQTVPVIRRVPNDPRRQATGQLVPSNYNDATTPPHLVAIPFPPPKPADLGGLVPEAVSPAVEYPDQPVPIPGQAGYIAPPAGWADTPNHPLVPAAVSSVAGNTELWVSLDKADNSAIMLQPDGGVVAKLPPDSVHVASGAGVALVEITPEQIPAPLAAQLFTATSHADLAHFTDGVAETFVTHFGSNGVAEKQSVNFADVTLEQGQKLTVKSNGVTVELTNTTNHSLSGDELASYVSEATPDGWTTERNGARVLYTALTVGDKDAIQVSYTLSETGLDGMVLADGGEARTDIMAVSMDNNAAAGWKPQIKPAFSIAASASGGAEPGTAFGTDGSPRYVVNVAVTEVVKGMDAVIAGSTLAKLDIFAGFNWLEDRIALPTAVTRLVKGAAELNGIGADDFSVLAGEEAGQVGAFQAGLFKYNAAYYLFINDGDQAFNTDTDIVIKLVGVSDADAEAMTADIFTT